ncbi:hypothetical protein FKM82_021749 [Ascaphus truei]
MNFHSFTDLIHYKFMLSCCNSVLSQATQTYFFPLINTHKSTPHKFFLHLTPGLLLTIFKKEVESIHQNIPSSSSYPTLLPTLYLLSLTLFPLSQKSVTITVDLLFSL